jgi:hypothetical protein
MENRIAGLWQITSPNKKALSETVFFSFEVRIAGLSMIICKLIN